MKKLASFFVLGFFLGLPAFLQPAPVAAEDVFDLSEVASSSGIESSTTIEAVIGQLIGVALGLLGMILLGIILYAGFLWMTAGGNSDQVDKAKDWMKNAVIGLVLVLAAYIVSDFVVDTLTTVVSA